MRIAYAFAAVLLGASCGYALTRQAQMPAPDADAPTSVATEKTTATPPPLSESARRPPRAPRSSTTIADNPLLTRSASLQPPPLPAAKPSWSPLLDSLRERAEKGDAAAAAEWLQRDARCYSMMPLTPEPGGSLPTPGFVRATMRGRSRLTSLDTEVAAAAVIEDQEQRRSQLGAAQQRLLDECRGYAPQPPQVRYALAEIAARLGTDKDFWRFIDDPPLAPGYSRDIEQAVDWARRAPGMVYERAAGGDPGAAYMLGLAYAIDNGRELDGNGRSRQLLAAAVTNDPLQAYRWLSVYLRSNPDDDRAGIARALLNRVGAELSAEQRAEAGRWSP